MFKEHCCVTKGDFSIYVCMDFKILKVKVTIIFRGTVGFPLGYRGRDVIVENSFVYCTLDHPIPVSSLALRLLDKGLARTRNRNCNQPRNIKRLWPI